jgi:hypothetical protein
LPGVNDLRELEPNQTCRKFRQVRQEGDKRVEGEIDYYNLDVIISVQRITGAYS